MFKRFSGTWSFIALLVMASLSASCQGEPAPDAEVGCRLNSDCAAGQLCEDGRCVEDEGFCEGLDCPCLTNADCAAGEGCDAETGECFALECLNDGDCALGRVCVSGVCETDTEADRDRDGVPDTEDLCPDDQDAGQEDNDDDGRGDVCDDDDDNDAIPDSIDNCVLTLNPKQGDADNDGQGNACDEDTPGIDVTGVLDASAQPGARTELARVFISGRNEGVTIDAQGRFNFDDALAEPGRFTIRVEWPSFAPFFKEFSVEDGVASQDLGSLVMIPTSELVTATGRVSLDGGEDNGSVLIEARANDVLVATTATAPDGAFLLNLAPIDHTLSFTREGFQPLNVTALFDRQGALAGEFTVDGVALREASLVMSPTPTSTLSGEVSSTLGELNDWPNRAFAVLIGNETRRIEPIANADDGKGQFQFAGLAPGEYDLEISAQGHQARSVPVSLLEGDNVIEEVTLEAQIDAAPVVLRGRVCRGACEGPADHSGILVRASIGVNPAGIAVSDADGDFALSTSGLDHQLEFQAQDFITQRVDVAWSEVQEAFFVGDTLFEDSPVELAQVPTATLSAQVSSSQGARNDWPNIAFATLTNGQERRTVGLDNDDNGLGQFQFVALPPGTWALIVSAQGHLAERRDLTLLAGANTLDVIALQEERDDSAVTMQGRISLQGEGEGGDNSGVLMRATVEGNPVATAQTASDGVFAFLASRLDHTLTFERVNYITRQVDVRWDEAQERFELNGVALNEAIIDINLEAQSDIDFDGIFDSLDNCPRTPNNGQENIDGDELGDACDDDTDGDGLVDGLDNCPLSFNPMQEDTLGQGRGAACSLGSLEDPIPLGCGVNLQRLDTRERADLIQGSCGGARAPEVVYELGFAANGEEWHVKVDADFTRVIYLINEAGQEVDCVIGGEARFSAPSGRYQLVIDGFSGPENAGLIDVSVNSDTACQADYPTTATGSFPATTLSGGMSLADFNSDGLIDAVLTDQDAESVTIMLGDGAGQFSRAQTLFIDDIISAFTQGVFTEDIDGDGHLDIVIPHIATNTLSLLMGVGDGTFVRQTLETGVGPFAFVFADLNEDSHKDLVVGNSGTLDLAVFLSDGQGGFVAGQDSLAVGALPFKILSTDFNRDGHADIVSLNNPPGFQGNASMGVFFGDGQGNLSAHEFFEVGPVVVDFQLVDLNNDHDLDMVSFGNVNNNVVVLLGTGGGDFGPARSYAVGDRPGTLLVGDLNNNGALDLVTLDSDDRAGSVLLNDGDGTFSPRLSFTNGNGAGDGVLKDVNNDGALDLLSANNSTADIRVLLNDGQGNLGAARSVSLPVPGGTRSLDAGDLNNDGSLDILAVSGSGRLEVFMGFPTGNFDPSKKIAADGLVIERFYEDLNNDGHKDLLTLNLTNRSLAFYAGDGRGHFAEPRIFDTGDGPYAGVLEDFNGDGHLDVAVGLVGLFEDDRTVNLLLGDGAGNFGPGTPFEVGLRPEAIAAIDVNDDGVLDIATANFLDDTVSLLVGDGEGGFAPQALFLTGVGPEDMIAADLNNDGDLDLVTLNRNGDSVTVLLNANGTLSVLGTFSVANNPRNLIVEDIDGDQRLDILTVSNSSDAISVVFCCDGRRQDIAVEAPSSIALADLNSDQIPDLVVHQYDEALDNLDSGSIGVMKGRGDGTFGAVIQMTPQATGPGKIALADFTNDGTLDAFLVSTGVRVFVGTRERFIEASTTLETGNSTDLILFDDFNGNGLTDFLVTTFDNTIHLFFARSFLRSATRFASTSLDECPRDSLSLRADSSFTGASDSPCQVERLELDLSGELPPQGSLTLFNPDKGGGQFVRLPAPRLQTGLNRPEAFSGLARFEGQPLAGQWLLKTDGPPLASDEARLLINNYPDDPFNPETLAPACSPETDQPSDMDFVCRLEGDAIGASIEDSDDEDVFLLEGAFDGAFIRTQTITLSLTTAPDAELLLEIRAHRARNPLAVATEVEPGLWEVSFEVPQEFSGRYFTAHVRAPAAELDYDLNLVR